MTAAFTVVEPVMGTVASITVVSERTERVERAIAACVARLRDDERVFSTYRDDSDISRLRDEGLELGDVDPRVAEVGSGLPRSAGAQRRPLRRALARLVRPDRYVKGWSTDAATRAFDELLADGEIEAVGVNVGGDMRLRTAATSDHVWRIGIAHPTHEGELLATVEVVDGAVATSGTSERGAHLVDPRTGVHLAGPVSATVIADDLTTADAWATVAAIAGIDDLDWMPVAPVASGIVWEHGRTRRFAGRVEVSAFHDALVG